MKKRILQYGLSSNMGGIEVVALNIFKNIDKDEFIFDYIVAEETMAFEEEIKQMGGKVYKITKRKKNPFKHYWEFLNFFRKNAKNYNAIHCSYCTLYSILPIILSKIFGISRIILHARSNKLNTNKLRLKLAHYKNRYVANAIATEFVAVSTLAAEFMFTPKRMRLEKYSIIKNPLELEKFKFNEKVRNIILAELEINNSFVLGHVGAFLPVKNHEFILDVFYELQLIYDNSKLILVGGGKLMDKIIDQADALGIKEKILFTGVIKNPYDYFQAMDAFIFPSLYEGFGNVLVEAQVSGLPCYASDTIPNEVKVTDILQFVSLEDSAKTWARLILKSSNKIREDRFTEVSMQGFSITECVKAYERLYTH